MGNKIQIGLPYKPRPAQWLIHKDRTRYRVVVMHRACGKSHLAINELIKAALTKKGVYAYVAPEKQQGKNISWDWIKEYVGTIPGLNFNETELYVSFDNKSKIHIFGADNPHRLRGMHMSGVVLDEVAQMPSSTWDEVIMPALQANKGWALFIGTPNGQNLFYDLYKRGQAGVKDWTTHTIDINTSGVFDAEQIESIKNSMAPDKFDQEYLCSFHASQGGAYYAKSLQQMEDRFQIDNFPYDPTCPVITAWDIGLQDYTAIWFAQYDVEKDTINVIDYYENKGKDLSHYLSYVNNRGYNYSTAILPHDSVRNAVHSKNTTVEQFKKAGHRPKVLKVSKSVNEDIAFVQSKIYRCYFNSLTTAKGITRLKEYKAKTDRMTGEFLDSPMHDKVGNSDCADAFRYLLLGIEPSKVNENFNKYMKRHGALIKHTKPIATVMNRLKKGGSKWRR